MGLVGDERGREVEGGGLGWWLSQRQVKMDQGIKDVVDGRIEVVLDGGGGWQN